MSLKDISFKGMSRTTGKTLDGIAHLRQSIIDILTTPKGTRVMRRDYGSNIAHLLDLPMNELFAADLYASIYEALQAYEPRLKLTKLGHRLLGNSGENGKIEVTIEGIYRPTQQAIRLSEVLL